ncbi:MAG: sodium/glutamate symporter [Desulfobacterales bacterium]|jgi:ESS family glutamate:Na+ symporter
MMPIPFPFEFMVLFGILATMLLIGVLLRARFSFFQNFLIPSCLIGGLLGLILVNTGLINLSVSSLETFAYHFFNLSFISVGLTKSDSHGKNSIREKGFIRGPLWMALSQTVCFSLQAILGGLIVIILGQFGMKLFSTFGFLAPLGFEEGPGQALAFGKVWEGNGFENAATIGITFATIGFFFAFFIGIPLVNWGIRKGLSTNTPRELPRDFLTGILPRNQETASAGKLTLHTANIDTLAFQAACIGLIYLLTYILVRSLGQFFLADVASMLWGFFFFFGLMIAFSVRWLMGKLNVDHLLDPGIQRRVTGFSIDFLIVSTIMAIKFSVVWKYILPISLISISCGILTTVMMISLGKRLWAYQLERTAVVFGTVTGTVTCGLLLLRVADPDFQTPAVIEIALATAIMLLPLVPLLVLVNATVWWSWNLGTTIILFLGAMLLALGLLKVLKLWQSPNPSSDEVMR